MPKSPARTLLTVIAGTVGALVVLVVGLTLLLQTGAVSSRVKDLVVPRVSTALGRQVTVADAKLRIFPHTRVALTGTVVAGRPGEPPLAQMEAFEVGVRLWPLLTSLGKDVQVSGIRLVRPILNLVRAKDGTWNYEGLGGEPKEKPAPASKEPAGSQATVLVDRASIEGGEVHYIDTLLGDKAAVALSRIDFSAEHVGLGHPLDAKLSAAVVNPQKNFEARVHASKLPESFAQLGPGEYPELQGDLALTGLDLGLVRAFLPPAMTNMMTGGKVDASAKLATREGKYAVDGSGKLSQVRLRGEPAQGSFELHALVDPASGAGTAAVEKLAVKGPGIDLGGRLAAELKPQRVRFAVAGPLLDLGQVMSLLPQDQKKSQGPLLTAAQRKQVGAADVSGTIDIEKVVKGGLVANGFKAKAALEEGVFVLHDAQASFFGGRVDAAGTRVDLSQANPSWNLKAKLDAIDLGQALTSFSGAAPLAGKLTGTLDLAGTGVDWPTLQKALTGRGALSMKQGELSTTDLGDKVLGAVSQGLRAAGKTGLAGTVGGAGGKTTLRDLAAQFTVKDGAMALARPLSFTAPFGATELGGKIGLGGQLALTGAAKLSKETLQRLAGGSKLPLGQGLTVPLALSGSLAQPSVSVQADQAVAGLVQGAAKQKVQELQDTAKEKAKVQARKGVGDLLRGL
ncbi:MAG TPA: AsmA family protein [Anaeromyxobacteraceae bacterium]|nr:AsmA family protein [Anaeromyxobacteraceae bacterium]